MFDQRRKLQLQVPVWKGGAAGCDSSRHPATSQWRTFAKAGMAEVGEDGIMVVQRIWQVLLLDGF